MRNKKLNIIIYFLVVLFYYLVFELATDTFLGSLVNVIRNSKYGLYIISEVCWLSFVLLVIFLFKDGKIFSEKKEGFFKTLIICFPLTFVAILYTLGNLRYLHNVPMINILGIAIYAFTIGLTEELLVRGWVLSRFFKKYSTQRKEVYLSIIFSALIFGGMHITNIWNGGQTISQTLIQVLFASAAGIFFGAAYFRSRNIFGVAFVHAFYDFSLLIRDINNLRDCTNFTVSSITRYQLFLAVCNSLILIISAIIIMRKSKTDPLFNKEVTPIQEAKDKEFKIRLIIVCIAIYLISNNVSASRFGITEADMKNYEICYYYPEITLNNVETIYNNYDKYTISNENIKYDFINKNNKLLLLVNGKKYVLAKEIIDFKIVNNNDRYTIYYLISEETSSNTIINYSNFLEKNTLSTEEDYINKFKKSFIKQGTPPANILGAIREEDYNYLFPILKDYNNNILMIDEENVVRRIVIDKSSRSDLIINQEKAKTEQLEKELYNTIPFVDFKNPEYLDAYRGTNIIIDNIELKNLLNNVYRLSKHDKLDIPVYSNNCLDANPCIGESYVDNNEIINKLKAIYNKDLLDITSFYINNGIVEQNNDYWIYFKQSDNPSIEKLSNIEVTYLEGNNFIIEEKAGFIYDGILSKYSEIDNSIIYKNDNIEELKKYFKNNNGEFSTFIHTFRYDETTNNYYYYSTEVK